MMDEPIAYIYIYLSTVTSSFLLFFFGPHQLDWVQNAEKKHKKSLHSHLFYDRVNKFSLSWGCPIHRHLPPFRTEQRVARGTDFFLFFPK